jgi:hypothetical protein
LWQLSLRVGGSIGGFPSAWCVHSCHLGLGRLRGALGHIV